MKTLAFVTLFVFAAFLFSPAPARAQETERDGEPDTLLYNSYHRRKNGPPLTNIFHKATKEWIQDKLSNSLRHPSARMPEMELTEEEVSAVMAYLESIADDDFPEVEWATWLLKAEDDLTDAEFDNFFELIDEGQAVWGNARCTICHIVNGPTGEIGGFVDVRVGGVNLTNAANKLERDWLFQWLQDPKNHFPRSLMPRYRFTDGEIRSLVEYILRDPTFFGEEELPSVETSQDPGLVEKGKRVIELSRCVVCHDIAGVPEILAEAGLPAPPMEGFEAIAYDVRCLTCHTIEGRGGTYAPDLTTAGSRLRDDWIGTFVKSPDFVRPLSQQMPRFNFSDTEAETISFYLKQSRLDPATPPAIPEGPLGAENLLEGKRLFLEKGCLACHVTSGVQGGAIGPDLTAVADRLTPGYMYQQLLDPHVTDPYSAEPDYGLTESEALSLAAFLASQGEKPGMTGAVASSSSSSPALSDPWRGLESPEDLPINRREQARGAFLATPSTLYSHYCASCHGETGAGDGRLWVTGLTPLPRDLTDRSYMADLDEEHLIGVITGGSESVGKSNLCPPWGNTLPEDKVVRLARYVKAFSSPVAPPETASTEVPPEGGEGERERAPFRESFPWIILGVIILEVLMLWRTGIVRLSRKSEA